MRRLTLRMRLALWHTVALSVVLSVFAAGMYAYMMSTLSSQVDRDLAESAFRFGQAVEAEFTEQQDITLTAAIGEVARDTRLHDRIIAVYNAKGALVARTFATADARSADITRLELVVTSRLVPVLANAAAGLATIRRGVDSSPLRIYTSVVALRGATYTVRVIRDLRVEEAFSNTIQTWLTVAAPIALALSGLGGYLIAWRTLQPITSIAETAERIGAQSLNARVDVANPHDELGRLSIVLNGLLERLERSFSQQQQFMEDASHDLRTPVAVLRSAADVALSREDRSVTELRSALGTVSSEGVRLTRLVDDLFLLARADAGQQQVARDRVYLEEVTEQCVRSARTLAGARNIAIDYILPPESPVTGDADLLSRALMNLLDNAVKHSRTGASIQLALHRDPAHESYAGQYRIVVGDSGNGVPAALTERIFDRFVRADGSRTRTGAPTSSGAGLGLAIARWIARQHGGDVRLIETGPTGSRFELTLPA